MGDGPTVQELVEAANTGDRAARARLFERLYGELHRLAQRAVSNNHAPLSATTLLHEVYLDVSTREGVAFEDRSRFMAYAARAMRGLIIDFWRNRLAQKRGGGFEFTSLGNDTSIPEPPRQDLVRLGEALEALTAIDPELAEIVDLKYFCGLSNEDIATLRGVSKRTVLRDWQKARLYLLNELQEE